MNADAIAALDPLNKLLDQLRDLRSRMTPAEAARAAALVCSLVNDALGLNE